MELPATLFAFLFLIATAAPHLPAGVGWGDYGDVQTAMATLGIARPPGYVGYVVVGRLWCGLLFWVEPARAVAIGCMVCMAGALACITALVIRAGLNAWMAVAGAVALVGYSTVWRSLTVPQVYAPSLFVLAMAMLLLTAYGAGATRRRLYGAAALFGFLVANRPMALLYAPGFVAAWLLIERDRHSCGMGEGFKPTRLLRTAAWVAVAAAVPVVGVIGTTVVLDRMDRPYNYIRDYALVHSTPEGHPGGYNRLHWLLTGEQFRYQMGADFYQMRAKFRWLRAQLGLRNPWAAWTVGLLLTIGFVRLLRADPALAVCSLGVGIGAVVYLLIYRVHSQSADQLPVLLAGAVFGGAALSAILPRSRKHAMCAWQTTSSATIPGTSKSWIVPGNRFLRGMAIGCCFVLSLAWIASEAQRRFSWSKDGDATPFLNALEVSTIPAGALILSDWGEAPALHYATKVAYPRADVQVVMASRETWEDLVFRDWGASWVLFPNEWEPPPPMKLEPWRNVWRLVRP